MLLLLTGELIIYKSEKFLTDKNSQNSIHESYIDIKVSLRLLKENWEAFLKTEVFALTAFISFIFLLMILILLNNLRPLPPPYFPRTHQYNVFDIRIVFIILVFAILIYYAFISSTYGLSHDIILSGDQFTTFDKSFTYFRKHFFYYTLLSLIILWIPMAFELDFHVRNFFEFVPDIRTSPIALILDAFSLYLVQYGFFVLLNLTLPSITSKGKLLTAFKENFNILLKNPKRILFSWGIFFIIFSLPSFLIMLLAIISIRFFLASVFLPPVFFIFGLIIVIFSISSVIIGYPIMSLIATRIYATTKQSYER